MCRVIRLVYWEGCNYSITQNKPRMTTLTRMDLFPFHDALRVETVHQTTLLLERRFLQLACRGIFGGNILTVYHLMPKEIRISLGTQLQRF